MTDQISITNDPYDRLLHIAQTLAREVRKLEREIKELKAAAAPEAPPAAQPENEPDPLGVRAAAAWRAEFARRYTEIETPPVTETRFHDGVLTVCLPPLLLPNYQERRADIERRIIKALVNDVVTLRFEAAPPGDTEASEGEQPAPEAEPEDGELAEAAGAIITGSDGKKYSAQPRPEKRRGGQLLTGEIVTNQTEMPDRAADRRVETHATEGDGQAKTKLLAGADTERKQVALKDLLAEVATKQSRPTAGERVKLEDIPGAAAGLTTPEGEEAGS